MGFLRHHGLVTAVALTATARLPVASRGLAVTILLTREQILGGTGYH